MLLFTRAVGHGYVQGALDIDYLLKLKNWGMVPLGNLLSPLSLFALLPAHMKETQKRAPSECVSTAVVCWDKRKRVEVVPRGTIPGFFNSSG